jgi:hypothetical protein
MKLEECEIDKEGNCILEGGAEYVPLFHITSRKNYGKIAEEGLEGQYLVPDAVHEEINIRYQFQFLDWWKPRFGELTPDELEEQEPEVYHKLYDEIKEKDYGEVIFATPLEYVPWVIEDRRIRDPLIIGIRSPATESFEKKFESDYIAKHTKKIPPSSLVEIKKIRS